MTTQYKAGFPPNITSTGLHTNLMWVGTIAEKTKTKKTAGGLCTVRFCCQIGENNDRDLVI